MLFLLVSAPVGAIYISVTGSWSETINSLDLQAGAGSDLISTYESSSDQVSISISDTSGNWRVDIKKIDTNWHNDLHLFVKRTSDGSGFGSISGGESYQEILDTYQTFFNGSGDGSNIHIQQKLSGVSVQIPPDSYGVTIYYTVVDID